MNCDDFDILVVGGGMVGATLAAALRHAPLRIALLEHEPFQFHWPTDDYDIRVSALTRATQRVFSAVGAWARMAGYRVSPYRQMRVWDATGSGEIGFDAADIGEPDLGHIVENSVILAALLETLADADNIEIIAPARCGELAIGGDGARITLEDGRQFTSRLVVGADGADSWVRRQVGIGSVGWPYDQHAVVATIHHAEPHGETAWQRFMPDGPLAFLPLDDPHLSSIVWSTAPDHAAVLHELPKQQFLDELGASFGPRLGSMIDCGERGVFPLQLRHARRYCAERVVLIGNAAHAIHPLAGQGLNLGVSDAAVLAELLLDTVARNGDVGDLALLRRYERWRKGDNLAVMGAMEGFKRLFGSAAPPVRALRNLGLGLVNQVGPLKNMMIRRAMGLTGELPRLAR